MLFCFDVDGTLLTDKMKDEGQYVKGIIPTSILRELEQKGHRVVIVSPSPFGPGGFKVFARNGSNDYRWENIKDAMDYYGYSKDHTVYVDDLQSNLHQIMKFGISSVFTPEAFMIYYPIMNR